MIVSAEGGNAGKSADEVNFTLPVDAHYHDIPNTGCSLKQADK